VTGVAKGVAKGFDKTDPFSTVQGVTLAIGNAWREGSRRVSDTNNLDWLNSGRYLLIDTALRSRCSLQVL
jgi:hypothetical protein